MIQQTEPPSQDKTTISARILKMVKGHITKEYTDLSVQWGYSQQYISNAIIHNIAFVILSHDFLCYNFLTKYPVSHIDVYLPVISNYTPSSEHLPMKCSLRPGLDCKLALTQNRHGGLTHIWLGYNLLSPPQGPSYNRHWSVHINEWLRTTESPNKPCLNKGAIHAMRCGISQMRELNSLKNGRLNRMM